MKFPKREKFYLYPNNKHLMKTILILATILFSSVTFSQTEADTCGFYVSPELSIADNGPLVIASNCEMLDFKFVLSNAAGEKQYESTVFLTPMPFNASEKVTVGDAQEYKHKSGSTYSWIIYYRLPGDTDAGMRMVTGSLNML